MSEKKRNIIVLIVCVVISFCLGSTITECRFRRNIDKHVSSIGLGIESGLEHTQNASSAAGHLSSGIDTAIELNDESKNGLNDIRRDTEEMLGTVTEAERDIEAGQGAVNSLEQLIGELESEESELEELLKRANF